MSKVAVLGSGISGMATAYFLSRRHEVVLFEKEDRLGGHTHTHEIETPNGPLHIDTGFLVHNNRTYPNFVRLLSDLGVQRQLSDMSFGVSHPGADFEYSSRDLRGFFAQRRNIFALRHYRFFLEILRFNRQARALLADLDGADLSLGEYLERNRFSRDFTRYYLYPMASAVWSTSLDKIADFPALTLIRFFDNHDFLRVTTQFPWYTVTGGSRSYIAPLTARYRDRIRLGVTITGVARTSRGVRIYAVGCEPEHFDDVVFACHAPQALGLLRDASRLEREVLSKFQTNRNTAVLHTDSNMLPRNPDARASWNYHLGEDPAAVTLTYHLNRLQKLQTAEDYCVTLNRTEAVRPDKILRHLIYDHPLFTQDAIRAQSRWAEISGRHHTHFSGAYWFCGFHEDGLNSALRVVRCLEARPDEREEDAVFNLRGHAAPPPLFAGSPRFHVPALHGVPGD
jgi:predicted NAD/FAD-binding protein